MMEPLVSTLRLRARHAGRFSALALLSLSLGMAGAAQAAPGAGDRAPRDFGVTLAGEAVTLEKYPGKVVVVSFWATWCAYCLKELPALEALQQVAAVHGLEVVAVNTESRLEFRKIERQLRSLTFKMTYDPDKKSASSYGVSGIPHLVIIGRDGRIVQVYRGYGEESLEHIVAAVNRALLAKPDGAE